jgi:hypothetical protein
MWALLERYVDDTEIVLMRSLMKDAGHFVSELTPLVERAIGAPMPDPPSPGERRLETVARLVPEMLAAAAAAEGKAEPPMIGFCGPDER